MAFFITGLDTEALALRAQPSLKLGQLRDGSSGAMTSSFQMPSSSFAALLEYMPSENPRDSGAASMWSRRWRILVGVLVRRHVDHRLHQPVALGCLAWQRRDAIVVATVRGLYRRESDGAGGFRWARKATPAGVIGTVVVARTGGVTTFFAAPLNGPVFRSANGNTWNVVGTGFPGVNVARVGLAVQPTNPNVLYALVAASDWSLLGVYRLDNSTGAWRQITGPPNDLFGTAVIGFQGGTTLRLPSIPPTPTSSTSAARPASQTEHGQGAHSDAPSRARARGRGSRTT